MRMDGGGDVPSDFEYDRIKSHVSTLTPEAGRDYLLERIRPALEEAEAAAALLIAQDDEKAKTNEDVQEAQVQAAHACSALMTASGIMETTLQQRRQARARDILSATSLVANMACWIALFYFSHSSALRGFVSVMFSISATGAYFAWRRGR